MNTKALVAQLLAAITPQWFLKYLSLLVSELGAGHITIINALLKVLADESPEKRKVRIWAMRKLSPHLGEKNVAEAFVRRLVNERLSNAFVDPKSKDSDLDWKVAAYLRKAYLQDAVSSALYAAVKDYSKPKLAAAAYRMACDIYSKKFYSTSDPAETAAPDSDLESELMVDFETKKPVSNEPRAAYLSAIIYPLLSFNTGVEKAEEFSFWALGALGELVSDPAISPVVIKLVNGDRHRLRIAAAVALKPIADRQEVQKALLTGLLTKQPSEKYSIENPEDIGNAHTYDSNSLRRACIEALAPHIRESKDLQRELIDALFSEIPGQDTDMLGMVLKDCLLEDNGKLSLGEKFSARLRGRVLDRGKPINEVGKLNLVALLSPTNFECCLWLLGSPNRSVQEIGMELINSGVNYSTSENILPQLAKLVPQVEPTLQAGLIAAIGKIFGARATGFLFSQLTAEDPQLRLAALHALVKRNVPALQQEIDQLISIASSNSCEEAILAIKLLNPGPGSPNVEELLISIAKDSKAPSTVRVAAVEKLGRGAWGSYVKIDQSGLKGLTALEHCISDLVLDPDVKVRLAAISQLPKSDGPRSAELLRGTRKLVGKLLRCTSDTNVDAAVAAIDKLRPIATDDDVAAVLAKLAHHDEERIAIAAMSTLAQSGISPDVLQP